MYPVSTSYQPRLTSGSSQGMTNFYYTPPETKHPYDPARDGVPLAPASSFWRRLFQNGKYNREQAEYARNLSIYNQYQSDMDWQRQTNFQLELLQKALDHNKVTNQRAQIEAAGLNAGLLYNSNPFQEMSAPNAPSLKSPQADAFTDYDTTPERALATALGVVSPLINTFQSIKRNRLANDLLSSQIASQNLKNINQGIMNVINTHKMNDQPNLYQYLSRFREYTLNNVQSQIDLRRTQQSLGDVNTRYRQKLLDDYDSNQEFRRKLERARLKVLALQAARGGFSGKFGDLFKAGNDLWEILMDESLDEALK